MKKIILPLILGAMLFFGSPAQALTNAEQISILQQQIQLILKQLIAIQVQLIAMLRDQSTATTSVTVVTTTPATTTVWLSEPIATTTGGTAPALTDVELYYSVITAKDDDHAKKCPAGSPILQTGTFINGINFIVILNCKNYAGDYNAMGSHGQGLAVIFGSNGSTITVPLNWLIKNNYIPETLMDAKRIAKIYNCDYKKDLIDSGRLLGTSMDSCNAFYNMTKEEQFNNL